MDTGQAGDRQRETAKQTISRSPCFATVTQWNTFANYRPLYNDDLLCSVHCWWRRDDPWLRGTQRHVPMWVRRTPVLHQRHQGIVDGLSICAPHTRQSRESSLKRLASRLSGDVFGRSQSHLDLEPQRLIIDIIPWHLATVAPPQTNK